jgi:hypothetical protein
MQEFAGTLTGTFSAIQAVLPECFLISYFDPANRAQNNFTLTFGVDYTLAESLVQCDPLAPRFPDQVDWLRMPPVGREIV